jgi:hypothetical protein
MGDTGIFYMEKAEGKDGFYYMEKDPDNSKNIYYMEKEEAPKEWAFCGTYSWSPVTGTTNSWSETPGSYSPWKILLKGYTEVWVKGVGGYYDDNFGTPPGLWLGALGFVTSCDAGTLGPGGSLESNAVDNGSQAAADEAFGSSELVLALGSDGILSWGFKDSLPTNNSGGFTFEVWAR